MPETTHLAITHFVQRRLEQTIAAASVPALEQRTGLTWPQIEAVFDLTEKRMDDALAERLDHAWSWFVHGSDTLAADFKHGVAQGYSSGYCRCRGCTNAQRISMKRHRAGVLIPHTIVTVPNLREHVQRLVDVAGIGAAARAAGVSERVVATALEGANVRVRCAKALIGTSPAKCEAQRVIFPAEPLYVLVMQMQALGYPRNWMVEQDPRITHKKLQWLRHGGTVQESTDTAVRDLAKQVGDTPATPAVGVEEWVATRARAAANRAGFYPPASYDDDGNLDPRAIPGHPWAKLDARADVAVQGARLLVTPGYTQTSAAAAVGKSDRKGGEWARTLGLTYVAAGPGETVIDRTSCQHVVRRVIEVHHEYESGRIGPVTAALTLGLLNPHSDKTNQEHPEVVAWIAAETRDEVAA